MTAQPSSGAGSTSPISRDRPTYDLVAAHCPKCLSIDIVIKNGSIPYNEILECLDCGAKFHRSLAIIGVDPVV